MKNKEKYADKIINYKGSNFCNEFVIPTILKSCECLGSCERCIMLQLLWLEEEYTEPKIDWSKVEVDTPILVRNSDIEIWERRHFAKFEDGKVYTWYGGRTSWSTDDRIVDWRYAKLVGQGESDE